MEKIIYVLVALLGAAVLAVAAAAYVSNDNSAVLPAEKQAIVDELSL